MIKIKIKISTHQRNVNLFLGFFLSPCASTVATQAFIYLLVFHIGIIVLPHLAASGLPQYSVRLLETTVITQDPATSSYSLPRDVISLIVHQPSIIWPHSA